MKTIQQKIGGGFELFFLFGRGIGQFDGTKKAALKSLWVALAAYLVTAAFTYLCPPIGMEQVGHAQVFLAVSANYIASFIITIGLIDIFSRLLKQPEKFWLALEAMMFVSLASLVISLPLMAITLSDWYVKEMMDRVYVVFSCYGYIALGCVMFSAFRVNWYLAGAFSCAALVIDQTLWEISYALQGLPYPWPY